MGAKDIMHHIIIEKLTYGYKHKLNVCK